MKTQDSCIEGALHAAVAAGVISRPHSLTLPQSMPFRAAICTIRLPEGCAPPTAQIPLRVGSGAGPTDEAAAFLAMAEAAERYALQYSSERPAEIAAVMSAGGPADTAHVETLTLGAPRNSASISRGAASGDDFEDAAQRALLECLESHHVRSDGTIGSGFIEYDAAAFAVLSSHLIFLSDQLRKLQISIHVSEFGYVVVRAVCCDLNSGRPTIGSAAGIDIEGATLRAAEEAILLWRNMIEIERSGLPANAVSGESATRYRLYRGAGRFEVLAPAKTVAVPQSPPPIKTPLHDILHFVTGMRVQTHQINGLEPPHTPQTFSQARHASGTHQINGLEPPHTF